MLSRPGTHRRLLSTVPVSQNLGSGAAGVDPFTTLEARVPSTGVARIEVLAGGSVVAARNRSGAPRARLLAPTAGRRVGGARAVRVRWRVSDADGDPVEVKLDFSRNGGRRFQNVWAGPDRGSALIPTELLDATTNARLPTARERRFQRDLDDVRTLRRRRSPSAGGDPRAGPTAARRRGWHRVPARRGR